MEARFCGRGLLLAATRLRSSFGISSGSEDELLVRPIHGLLAAGMGGMGLGGTSRRGALVAGRHKRNKSLIGIVNPDLNTCCSCINVGSSDEIAGTASHCNFRNRLCDTARCVPLQPVCKKAFCHVPLVSTSSTASISTSQICIVDNSPVAETSLNSSVLSAMNLFNNENTCVSSGCKKAVMLAGTKHRRRALRAQAFATSGVVWHWQASMLMMKK